MPQRRDRFSMFEALVNPSAGLCTAQLPLFSTRSKDALRGNRKDAALSGKADLL
jgi:hypothetical protein